MTEGITPTTQGENNDGISTEATEDSTPLKDLHELLTGQDAASEGDGGLGDVLTGKEGKDADNEIDKKPETDGDTKLKLGEAAVQSTSEKPQAAETATSESSDTPASPPTAPETSQTVEPKVKTPNSVEAADEKTEPDEPEQPKPTPQVDQLAAKRHERERRDAVEKANEARREAILAAQADRADRDARARATRVDIDDEDAGDDDPTNEGTTLSTELHTGQHDHDRISAPDEDNIKDNVVKNLRERREKRHAEPNIEEIDKVEKKTAPRVSETGRYDIDRLSNLEEKMLELNMLRQEDAYRFLSDPDNVPDETPEEWGQKNPILPRSTAEKKEVRDAENMIASIQLETHLLEMSQDELEEFALMTPEERAAAIRLKNEQNKKEMSKKNRGELAKAQPERDTVKSSLKIKDVNVEEKVKEFIESLSLREYAEFVDMPEAERDAMIKRWLDQRLDEVATLRRYFIDSLDPASLKKFEGMSDAEKLETLFLFKHGSDMKGFGFRSNGGEGGDFYENERYDFDADGNQLQPASYFTYEKYVNEQGEEYLEGIQKHEIRYNTLTAEQKKQLSKTDRFIGYMWGHFYNLISNLFDLETKIAEENKHNQEMIRNIVDTGPDYNERIVFAQKVGDVYLDYNGNRVSPQIVHSMQKKALHNPSRFQALCHYELSKREEPEQARLWEEIFEMMAHHNYGKAAMWGVVVGLQFMNKPSYLAYKNAIIEWAPEYVTELDDEGHTRYKRDDDDRLIEKRYTADMIAEAGGKLKDADGKLVQVGDIIRSRKKARFATKELILQPGDQEYDQINPENARDMYEIRTRKIRSKTPILDEKGNSTKEYAVIRTETYKVKTMLKLKELSYAHELAGKFPSYQYGFRSADVAITLDVARSAMQTSLACARKGDFSSKEFQISQYVLSRLKMTVDKTRLGGGAGDNEPSDQNLALQQEAAARMKEAGWSDDQIKKGFTKRQGYPPSLSGTAEANVLWEEVARVVDRATEIFPHLAVMLRSDLQAIQLPALPHAA